MSGVYCVRTTTLARLTSVRYVLVSRYQPLFAVVVTVHIIPEESLDTVYVVSRLCRSVKVDPSVTTYCIVWMFVVSIVGAYTSERTPPAIVYQILDVVLRAVPRQSLRARSKWLRAPGPSPALATGAAATGLGVAIRTDMTSQAVAARQLRRLCMMPTLPDGGQLWLIRLGSAQPVKSERIVRGQFSARITVSYLSTGTTLF